jgi:hypothetical protein
MASMTEIAIYSSAPSFIMPVQPLEQRPTAALLTYSVNGHNSYNCPESVEVCRRLCAGTEQAETLTEETGMYSVESIVIYLGKAGQWQLMCEILKRLPLASIKHERMNDIYRMILKKSPTRLPKGATLEALKFVHALGITAVDVDNLLQMASCYHDREVVRFIVETLGAKVNSLGRALCWCHGNYTDSASPLCMAVYHLNKPVVEYLLSVKASVTLEGKFTYSTCVHSPIPMTQFLAHWFDTRDFPANSIHPWKHVPDKAATIAEIAEMLHAAPPDEEEPLA